LRGHFEFMASETHHVHGKNVILSAAKDLVCGSEAAEILRCAQDDEYSAYQRAMRGRLARTAAVFPLDFAGCRRVFAFAVGNDSRPKNFGVFAGFPQLSR
jgi:hypothetical protein